MSGGFSPVNLVVQIGLGAMTGGASLALQAAMTSIASAVVQQVVQQLGQQMGLPQSVIDIAQGAAAGAMGDTSGVRQNTQEAVANVGAQFGASPAQQGEISRATDSFENEMLQRGLDIVNAQGNSEIERQGSRARTATGPDGVAASLGIKGGFLVALATVMGEILDKKMNDLAALTEKMNDISQEQKEFGKVTQENNAEFTGLQSEMMSTSALLQGVSKEMDVLSQALNTTIKSVGEAQSGLARKQ